MKKFNHVGNISFSVISDNPDGATSQEIMYAILRRLVTLPADEIKEAVELDNEYESDEDDQRLHQKIFADANDERKSLVDKVHDYLIKEIKAGDSTILESLLQYLPDEILVDSLGIMEASELNEE